MNAPYSVNHAFNQSPGSRFLARQSIRKHARQRNGRAIRAGHARTRAAGPGPRREDGVEYASLISSEQSGAPNRHGQSLAADGGNQRRVIEWLGQEAIARLDRELRHERRLGEGRRDDDPCIR